MMRLGFRVFSSTILIVLLSACSLRSPKEDQQYFEFELDDHHIEQIKRDVIKYLDVKDGLFSGLNASKSLAGKLVVCGWVRKQDHKFSYPRYPINQPFAALYTRAGDRSYNISAIHFAIDRNQIRTVELYCSKRNTSL